MIGTSFAMPHYGLITSSCHFEILSVFTHRGSNFCSSPPEKVHPQHAARLCRTKALKQQTALVMPGASNTFALTAGTAFLPCILQERLLNAFHIALLILISCHHACYDPCAVITLPGVYICYLELWKHPSFILTAMNALESMLTMIRER